MCQVTGTVNSWLGMKLKRTSIVAAGGKCD